MKRLVFALISIFTFVFSISAQSPCPSISIKKPSKITFAGDSMIFTLDLSGESFDKFKYNWTISSGAIINGQGTSQIEVATTDQMNGPIITATVEISGLPESCPNIFSASDEVSLCSGLPMRRLIDEFFMVPTQIRKEKFENLALELKSDQYSTIYIAEKFKDGTSHKTIKQRINNDFYLIEKLKLDQSRIIITISNDDENLTQFWVVPFGADPSGIDGEILENNNKDFQKNLNKLFPPSKVAKPKRKQL